MIGLTILEAAATTAPAQSPSIYTELGIFLGLVLTAMTIMNTWKAWKKDDRAELRDGQDTILKRMGENRDALQKEIADNHRATAEDIEDIECRVERVETKVEAFMPEEKIVGLINAGVHSLKHQHSQELQKQLGRIERLETSRAADIERIVKLETNITNLKEGQARIEHGLERLGSDMGSKIDQWADKLATSIREVRDVKPRN